MDGTLPQPLLWNSLRIYSKLVSDWGHLSPLPPICSLTEPWFPHPSERKNMSRTRGLWEAKENLSGVWLWPQ